MALKKNLLLIAFLITVLMLLSLLLLSKIMDNSRANYLDDQVRTLYEEFNDFQTFFLMAQAYGDEMACLAFDTKIKEMDKSIWKLGQKIDEYRAATEQFRKSGYYYEQKKTFNENEVLYLVLLKTLKERCGFNQEIILFFYRNSEDCKKCDDQSFVLTDINKDIDQEIAIFSFDMDIDITKVNLLSKFYEINELPCLVINETTYCGIRDKDFIINTICETQPSISACG